MQKHKSPIFEENIFNIEESIIDDQKPNRTSQNDCSQPDERLNKDWQDLFLKNPDTVQVTGSENQQSYNQEFDYEISLSEKSVQNNSSIEAFLERRSNSPRTEKLDIPEMEETWRELATKVANVRYMTEESKKLNEEIETKKHLISIL